MASQVKHPKLGHIKCTVMGHKISSKAEEDLFKSPTKNITTKCIECGVNLCVQVDEDNPNMYIVKEI